MNEILSGLIVGIIVLFVSPIFTRNNNEQNSLNTQSDWRKKLSKLSYKESINIEDLKEFRSCLSISRGFYNYLNKNTYNLSIDLRFKDDMSLDDTCLQYYRYIILNKFICFKFDGYMNIKKLDEKHAHVFRLLCLLLLKSDWNNKISSNSFFNFFKYKNYYDDTELKAVYIITKLTDDDKKIIHHDNKSYSNRYHYFKGFVDPGYRKYYEKVLKKIEEKFNDNVMNNEFIKSIDYRKKTLITGFFIVSFIVPLTIFALFIDIYDLKTYFFILYYLIFYIPLILVFFYKNNKLKFLKTIIISYLMFVLIVSSFYIFESFKYISFLIYLNK